MLQNVEIGEVPNHIVRLFDTVAAIPKGAATTVAGLALVEVSARGPGDLIDGHGGSNAGYLVFTGESGDKFSRAAASSRSGCPGNCLSPGAAPSPAAPESSPASTD